ncbi:MAG: hypothetical protein N3F65_05165 [Nitrososphaeria archaeon]|nr:hypothetical protein [Nitrososphaeria archaeon]
MKLDRKIIAILVVAFITASYEAGLILTNYMKNIGDELLPARRILGRPH